MLFYSPKPDSFLDGYILRFFLILIAMFIKMQVGKQCLCLYIRLN